MGSVCATNITDTDTGHINTLEKQEIATIKDNNIYNPQNYNENKNNNTHTQDKHINKKTTSINTKSESEITVYNASQLEQAIRDGINIINMEENEESNYTITSLTVQPPQDKEITINGNGITITGNNLSDFINSYLYLDYGTSLTVNDVTFKNFNLEYGIFFLNDEENDLDIINCTFTDNIMSTYALINVQSQYNYVVIRNSTFKDNIGTGVRGVINIGDYVEEGVYAIVSSKFVNNHVLTNGSGPISVDPGVLDLKGSVFENNTRANFEIKQDENGKNYIELVNDDNIIKNIMKYEIFLNDEDMARYEGPNISTFKFEDYKTIKIVAYGTDELRYNNNKYIFRTPEQEPKTYEVNNYDELAQAIDEAKTLNNNRIIITLKPGGNYNATTNIIWGKTYNNQTEVTGTQPKNLTINGNGTILDGKNNYQFMHIERYYNLTIENITIANYTATEGGAFYLEDETEVYMTNTELIGNKADKGGAVYAIGEIFINNSSFKNNTATDNGGALYKYGVTLFNITNSNFTDNTPSKFEVVKDDNSFILKIKKDDYNIYNSEVEIFEDNISQGVFNIDDNGIVNGYTVPTGKTELLLIVNSSKKTIYNNNQYKLSTNAQEYKVEIEVNNDTYDNVKINVTVKDEDNQPLKDVKVNLTLPDGTNLTGNTDTNGNITFTPQLPMGNNTLNITVPGNESIKDYNNTITVNVKSIPTTTSIELVNSTIKNTTIKVTVKDDKEILLDKGIIVITNKDDEIIAVGYIKDEQATIKLDLPAGKHNITATYQENTTHRTSSTTQEIQVLHQAEITIEIQNNTEGNVKAKIKVNNEEGTPITDELEITLPNGTKIKDKADTTGNLVITDTTATPGEKTITVTLANTTDTIGTTLTTQLTVIPDYQKTIDEMNKTIKEQNTTINELNETVKNQTQTINELNNTVQEQNTTINELNETVKNQTQTINELNNTVQKQNTTINNLKENLTEAKNEIERLNTENQKLNNTINNLTKELIDANNTINNLTKELNKAEQEIKNLTDELNKTKTENKELTEKLKEANNQINNLSKELNETKKSLQEIQEQLNKIMKTIDELNKTSVLRAIPENTTVGESKVIITLDNKLDTPITNAPITVKNSKGETIGTGKTDNNGVAIIPVNTKAGTENITVTYPGSTKYTPTTVNTSITTTKRNVTLTVDPVTGIIGEDITFTAHLVDERGQKVNGGNLVFKLNGKTLRSDGRFDSNATVLKFKVNNGKVTVTIKADLYLRNSKNLTASYSGSYMYKEAKSEVVTAQIKKRNAQISITATPTKQKQYQTITFTATLKDITPNTNNKTAINENTRVQFKINGKTIKDSTGKNVEVKVVNNKAVYKYTVPKAMAGIDKTGILRNYNVTCVLVSDTYYPDTRNTTYFNVERSPVTINIKEVSVNSANKVNIQANIKDYKNNNVVGSNDISLKINGKTYLNPKTGKTQVFQVTDGKINIKGVQLKEDVTLKKLMVVTGARQAYLGARNETSNIIKA